MASIARLSDEGVGHSVKKAPQEFLLLGLDRRQEVACRAHATEGIEATFQELVQVAESGELCGAPHHLEETAQQRFCSQSVERLAGFANQHNLSLALGPAGYAAVGRGVADFVDLLDPSGAAQFGDHCRVELFGQGVEFDSQRDSAQRRRRQHLDQQGQNALDFLVAAAEVLWPVEIGDEKPGGGAEACAGEQFGMGACQATGLPFTQVQARARRRRVEVGLLAQVFRGFQVSAQRFGALPFLATLIRTALELKF